MKSAITAILLLTVVLILLIAPITRMFYRFSITYNEGWTVYHSDAVAKGRQIYDKDPFTPVVYPPLFFYLEGLTGKLFGNFLVVGRIFSLIGLIASGIFAALIVRIFFRNGIGAICAALFFCGAVAAIAPQYVAMNDAQLCAHVLSAAGLWTYLRSMRSNSSLWLAALLVTSALFTKHNLLAIPAAISIDLLLRSKWEFLKWILFVSIFVAAFTVLTFLFAGPGFIDQVIAGRYISIEKMLAQTRQFGTFALIPLIASIVWCVRSWRSRDERILILWMFLSIVVGTLTASGFGTAMNMFFDAFLCMAVILGIWISSMKSVSQALLPLILFLSIEVAAISELQPLLSNRLNSRFAKQQAEFLSDVQFLKDQPGSVVCGNPLLCFDAGKPLEFDPFNVSQRIIIGKMNENDAVQLFESGHFQMVQIKEQHYEKDSARSKNSEMFADTFFTRNMIAAIRENYVVVRRSQTGNFYSYNKNEQQN